MRISSAPACAASYETKMLSPHEFATLILVKHAPDQIGLGHADLEALLKRQLVALKKDSSDKSRHYITDQGDALLHAVARLR
jgi:hypothetical protein